MTPERIAAGKCILRYAYETCDLLKVPREDIADLLNTLSMAVAEGQHEGDISPEPVLRHASRGYRMSPELIAEIQRLRSEGVGPDEIRQRLHVSRTTIQKYSTSPVPRSGPEAP